MYRSDIEAERQDPRNLAEKLICLGWSALSKTEQAWVSKMATEIVHHLPPHKIEEFWFEWGTGLLPSGANGQLYQKRGSEPWKTKIRRLKEVFFRFFIYARGVTHYA